MKKRKTIEIFDSYFDQYDILQEQTPEFAEGQVPGQEVQPDPSLAQASPPATPKMLDNNERHIIKILTNAFIFNPSIFDKTKQKFIQNKIESIKRLVNVPVSKVIDEVKKVISLDRSLKVESKTLDLISKYMLFVEQVPDATDKQDTGNTTPDVNTPVDQKEGDNIDGESKLGLDEIFPLYKELILQALKHVPTDEELMIIKPIVNEFGDIDPEKIVEAIQNILSQSLEDSEVEDDLSNV